MNKVPYQSDRDFAYPQGTRDFLPVRRADPGNFRHPSARVTTMSQSALEPEPSTRGSINRNAYYGIFTDLGKFEFSRNGTASRPGVYSASSLRDLATGIFKLISSAA